MILAQGKISQISPNKNTNYKRKDEYIQLRELGMSVAQKHHKDICSLYT